MHAILTTLASLVALGAAPRAREHALRHALMLGPFALISAGPIPPPASSGRLAR